MEGMPKGLQTIIDYEIKVKNLQAQIDGMEETIRERDQLIANQGAEIHELREALTQMCKLAEDLEKQWKALKECIPDERSVVKWDA